MRIGYFAYSLSGIGPRTRARTLIDAIASRTEHEVVLITGKNENYSNPDVEIHKCIEMTPFGLASTAKKVRQEFFDVDLVHVPVNVKQLLFVRSLYRGPIVAGDGIQHSLTSRTIVNRLDIDKMIETHEFVSYLWWKSGVDSTYVYMFVDRSEFFEYSESKKKEIRRELNVPEDSEVLLFVGKLNKFKGAQIFEEVIKDLDRDDITPIVVGDGPLRSRFEDRPDILYEGFVDNKSLPKYYNIADITLVPSVRESFSLVSLESAACGTPVITTSSEDYTMARLFKNRGTYRWASDRSSGAIIEEINSLLNESEEYAKQVDLGKQTIEEMGLTTSDAVERHIQIYTNAIKE